MVRALLTRLAFLASLAACGAAGAATPEQTIALLYERHYVKAGTPGMPLRPELVRRYFTPRTAALMLADQAEARKARLVPRIDFDIFMDSQDFGAPPRVPPLTVSPSHAGRATVLATDLGAYRTPLPNGRWATRQRSIRFELVATPRGWRIDDMRWSTSGDTLLGVLARPL